MATALYERMLAFDHGDAERAELMRKVWGGHPWMVNAYTGGHSSGRDREYAILTWCIDQIGEQASPIHGKPGLWYRGSATINGWTWMGFTNEADMNRFIEQWPAPPGIIEQ